MSLTNVGTRRLAAGVISSLMVLVGTVASPSAVSADPPPGVLRYWAPEYMDRTGKVTKDEAIAAAKGFDFIFAQTKTYSRYVADMKKANPKVTLLAYFNLVLVSDGEAKSLPESYFAHDKDGNRVRQNLWPLTLLDVSNLGAVANRIGMCKRLLASSHYDGCGLDVMGPAPVNPPFGPTGFMTAQPINPATGQGWTANDFMAATRAMARAMKTAIGGRPIMGNGLAQGPTYFDPVAPTSQLLDSIDVGMAEGFLRNGRALIDLWPTVDEWKQHLAMVTDARVRFHKPIAVVTKTFVPDATPAQREQWHTFSFASYALVADGNTRWAFNVDQDVGEPGVPDVYATTNLGAPLGDYKQALGGAYTRAFANGVAAVNPSTASVTIKFSRSVRRLDGSVVSGTLTMPAHTGDVFIYV